MSSACKCTHRAFWESTIARYSATELREKMAEFPLGPNILYNRHQLRIWEQLVRRQARRVGIL